jgi:hypothetical protein
MILSQMGINDIYIVFGDIENETFKYKFLPDTIIIPELQVLPNSEKLFYNGKIIHILT